jgi:hypothetical protein
VEAPERLETMQPMKPILSLSSDEKGYYVVWILDVVDNEEGAIIGQGIAMRGGRYVTSPEVDRDPDLEYVAVEREAAAFANENPDTICLRAEQGILRLHSKALATKLLRRLKLAQKLARANKPLPDWARQATTAGWKPPKGWTP